MSNDPKEKLHKIWELSGRLRDELDGLSELEPNRVQRAAIGSVQTQYRWWRCTNLGELLNEFGIPSEDRK